MAEHDLLTDRFAEHRDRLTALAYRMLSSRGDAEDAVQEAWLRVSRADTDQVENPAGWLTTVVARVCLNMLESRRARREDTVGAVPPEPTAPHARPHPAGHADPEGEALLADSVGDAMMVVLDTLTPAERLAFVLHDVFDVSFGEIAAIIDRSPEAARQLASRARRRVRSAEASEAARSRNREVVAAFLAASREGDFAALLTLLDPGAVLVADPATVRMGAIGEIRGAEAVAATFAERRAKAARLALIDGTPGAVWTLRGEPTVLFRFTISGGKITTVALDSYQHRRRDPEIVFLGARNSTPPADSADLRSAECSFPA
jgi:RNA polymerase sigma factor (sigma-70 family)